MTKKGRQFFRGKIGVTSSVAASGDTNPSDANVHWCQVVQSLSLAFLDTLEGARKKTITMRRGLYWLNSTILSCRLNAPNYISSLKANCSTHEIQRQKNYHRKCCVSVVGSMSCHWQNEDFGDHDRQPVGCQQPDTSVSDQTTTDAQDRQSWTRSVVGRTANAAAV